MKICFLAAANSLHSYRWIRFFADKGHDVHWLSLYRLSLDEYGLNLNSVRNLYYYEMNPPLTIPLTLTLPLTNIFRIFPAVKWLRGLLKDINPDLLHVHSVGIYGLVAAMSGFHPLVATAWGSDVLVRGRSRIKRPFVKYILNSADIITCDAKHMVHAMVKLGADKKKISIINFGIDTNKFRPAEKDEVLRTKLRIEGCPVVLSLRKFYPVYDIESLIKAIPIILKVLPDAKFIIVGSGPEEEYIKRLSKSLAVEESIRFTGNISNEELLKYLSFVDIYTSTALSDAGIASSTAEAMACGLPVVITDSGENSEWIKDGEGGFLVPVKSPEALAEKIVCLLKDNDLREKSGAANRKTIMEKNDYYKEMAKMEEIYDRVSGRNSAQCKCPLE